MGLIGMVLEALGKSVFIATMCQLCLTCKLYPDVCSKLLVKLSKSSDDMGNAGGSRKVNSETVIMYKSTCFLRRDTP